MWFEIHEAGVFPFFSILSGFSRNFHLGFIQLKNLTATLSSDED